ncbi:uncharacterized protein AB675_1832 [Cyphellophora attinorum]|uniref:Cupin 2 conserved barrel domain-containing protein n=1 Tax=Cyphellophora attinorum TaxID=1664694 RepID=A0A0N1HUG6_9EURO|nr:uncharacterized protein AB675_1832 [Phialophora attinorum]KPI43027.1 hypothetical protein AB675_1832 [Phialophora attinorum]
MARSGRADTTSRTVLTLERPGNNVVSFDLAPDSDRPYATRVTIPAGSPWTPAPHWHEGYTEYVACISGRLLVRLNGVDKVVTPDDGPQVIDKGVVHEFMRADLHGYPKTPGKGDGGDVVAEEWTDPADGMKHVFFRNLFSVLEDQKYFGWKFVPQVMYSLRRHDNWNVMLGSGKGGVGWFGWTVTHTVYALGEGVAKLIGLRPWYEEYIPANLREVAAKY